MTSLFQPLKAGAFDLPNRVVLAPLTRSRADNERTPTALMTEYYARRAGFGLIVTEATSVDPLGVGYPRTPGLWSRAQVQGWARVTDAVHQAGGRIVAQLWHVGRVSHVSLLPPGEVPVAPSAIRADTKTFTPEGYVDVSTPRALDIAEIPAIVEDFRRAARNAISAGFDGVEAMGVEGVAGWFGELFDRWDDPEVREAIMFSARAVESEPAVIGASAHLLMVARRPAG